MLDVDPQTIYRWERGKSDISYAMLLRLSRILGHDLLDPTPEPFDLAQTLDCLDQTASSLQVQISQLIEKIGTLRSLLKRGPKL